MFRSFLRIWHAIVWHIFINLSCDSTCQTDFSNIDKWCQLSMHCYIGQCVYFQARFAIVHTSSTYLLNENCECTSSYIPGMYKFSDHSIQFMFSSWTKMCIQLERQNYGQVDSRNPKNFICRGIISKQQLHNNAMKRQYLTNKYH